MWVNSLSHPKIPWLYRNWGWQYDRFIVSNRGNQAVLALSEESESNTGCELLSAPILNTPQSKPLSPFLITIIKVWVEGDGWDERGGKADLCCSLFVRKLVACTDLNLWSFRSNWIYARRSSHMVLLGMLMIMHKWA